MEKKMSAGKKKKQFSTQNFHQNIIEYLQTIALYFQFNLPTIIKSHTKIDQGLNLLNEMKGIFVTSIIFGFLALAKNLFTAFWPQFLFELER